VTDAIDSICRECHAEVAGSSGLTACPACGGALSPAFGADLAEPGAPPRAVDRRGILLPRRHAVGGIITPR